MTRNISRSSSYTIPCDAFDADSEHQDASLEQAFGRLLKSSKQPSSDDFQHARASASKVDQPSLHAKTHISYQGRTLHYRLLNGPLGGLTIKAWYFDDKVHIKLYPKPQHSTALKRAIEKLAIKLNTRQIPVLMEIKDEKI